MKWLYTNVLQFLGGYGYMEEYPMARLLKRQSFRTNWWRDLSEILREIIAKMVIDKKEYKPAVKH